MKREYMRKIMVLLLCLSYSTAVYGAEKEDRQEIIYYLYEENDADSILRYTLISQMGIGLTITNRTAYIYTECKTYDTADITLKAELQRNDNGTWNTVKTYSKAETGAKLCVVEASYGVTMNYEYRVKLTVTAQTGSVKETDTKYGTVQTAYSVNTEEKEAYEEISQ